MRRGGTMTHEDRDENYHALALEGNRVSVRAYKQWPSKNRFLCGGRFITGPWEDCCPNMCVWGLLLGPSFAFFVFGGAELWRSSRTLFFVVIVFLFWAIVTLCLTSFTDPGILPRRKYMSRMVDPNNGGIPKMITREWNGKMLEFRYCSTCNIFRPPRASHCRICDNCVKEFDHHCPFVGNCVAERNFTFFISFLFAVISLLVAILVSFIIVFQRFKGEEVSDSVNYIGIVIISLFSLGMCTVLGSFFSYHIMLIIRGETTKERLTKNKKIDSSDETEYIEDPDGYHIMYPTDEKSLEGRRIWCWQRPPSLIQPREWVPEE